MDSLAIIAAIVAVPAVTGAAVDRFLLTRTKSALWDRLLFMWNRLDETSIPKFPRLIAMTTLNAGSRLLGVQCGWPTVLGRTMLISFVLTYSALWLGSAIDSGGRLSPLLAARRYQGGLFMLLSLNLLFDFATAYITWHVLQIVTRSSFMISLVAIACDTLIAVILAFACALTALRIGAETPSADLVVRSFDCFACVWSIERGDLDEFTIGLYSSTALLPTFAYMLMLTIVLIAKPVLGFGKRCAMYFLEKTIEDDDPKNLIVFTLSGSLCSIVVAIVTAAVKVVTILSE